MRRNRIINNFYILTFAVLALFTKAQQSYTFTAAGATGSLGPTPAQISAAYGSTNLNGLVSSLGGIQSFTVLISGNYRIDAFGASGGNRSASTQLGGLGAHVSGEFSLVQGDVIRILVGQRGVDGTNTASGGGGSFVENNGTLLIAAGAGGGATGDNNAAPGTTLTAGTVDFPGGSIPGGTSGSGGGVCNSSGTNHGGGGGGYSGNGQTSTLASGAGGGLSFLNGGTGGASTVPGAFGGGGGATKSGVTLYGGGGGGGGYSGGAGGQQVNHCTPGIARSGGGGGGSYNSGSNQTGAEGIVSGDGTVIITELCNLTISAANNPVCFGSAVTLSTNAVTTLSWSSGSSTSSSISVIPSGLSTYSVTGIGTIGSTSCMATAAIHISITALPNISTVVSPQLLCVGKSATLSATGALTYTWSSSAMGSSTTVNPGSSTIYTVSGTNSYGCVNTKTASVLVNSNALSVSPSTTICRGNTALLSAGGAVTYTWNTGTPLSSIIVSPTVSTVYTVSGIDQHFCRLSNSVTVTVNQLPAVIASADKSVVCSGESVNLEASGAATYVWSHAAAGNANGAIFSPQLNLDLPYTFTVTGTDNNGCMQKAFVTVAVEKCTGLNALLAKGQTTSLFPNPTSGTLFLNLSEGPKVVTISDISGKQVYTKKHSESQLTLDLTDFSNGVYTLKVESSTGTEVLKVVKE